MKALVVIAHGSRRVTSNQEVARLAQGLSQTAARNYPVVEAGFLEIARPSIPEAIRSCIERGASSVVVVPYFLAAGRHVVEDIPRIVKPVAERFPHVGIRISEHVGLSPSMPALILESADSQNGLFIDPGLEQAV